MPDHCTWFPEGCWADCCEEHDNDYKIGGDDRARRYADEKLFCCLWNKGHKIAARVAYRGVRLFGSKYWKWHFKWCYHDKENRDD